MSVSSFIAEALKVGMSLDGDSSLESNLETAYGSVQEGISSLREAIDRYDALLCMVQYYIRQHNKKHNSPSEDKPIPTGPSEPWNVDDDMPLIPCGGRCGEEFPTTQSPHYVQCGGGRSESVYEEIRKENPGMSLTSDIVDSLARDKLRGRDAEDGCGRFDYNCRYEEYHKIRTCQKWIIVNGVRTERCGDSYRRCMEHIKDHLGINPNDGDSHEDDPSKISDYNEVVGSNLLVAPPDDTIPISSSDPEPEIGLYPYNGSSYYANGGDLYNMKLVTENPFSQVYWYIKSPTDTTTTYGNNIETDYGDGSTTTEATLNYTLPIGTPGTYTITAYIYYSDSIAEENYGVYVY